MSCNFVTIFVANFLNKKLEQINSDFSRNFKGGSLSLQNERFGWQGKAFLIPGN
jgi:hypothetical protein